MKKNGTDDYNCFCKDGFYGNGMNCTPKCNGKTIKSLYND